jgi:hypothetical protein
MKFFSHHKDTKIGKGSKFLPFTFVYDTLNNKMNLLKKQDEFFFCKQINYMNTRMVGACTN